MTGTPLDRANPFVARVIARLNMSESVTTEEQFLAVVDVALEPRKPKPFKAPAGHVLVDQGRYDELIATVANAEQKAAAGRRSRARALVQTAMAEGRVAAFVAEAWIDQAEQDEVGTGRLLRSLPANQIPMQELGHSDGIESNQTDDDVLFGRLFKRDSG